MNNQIKDIIYICDDNYCLPTVVSILSVVNNGINIDGEVSIHVCTFGLSESNKILLRRIRNNNVRLCIDVFDKCNDRINRISQKSHVTPSALIKFELANYFSNIDQILYLDSDIIVKGDLNKLLEIDITNCYLAASYEFYCHLNRIRYTLHRSVSNEFYFNSGVMLMNLKKMREDNISDKLWDYKLFKAKTRLMDQECLNAICGNSTIHLPIKWNFNPRFLCKIHLDEINRVYLSDYQTVKELENDVAIIHYVGKTDKPWVYKNAHMRDYWDNEYKKMEQMPFMNLKESEDSVRSFFGSIHSKLKNYGIVGTLCFILYTINCKWVNLKK